MSDILNLIEVEVKDVAQREFGLELTSDQVVLQPTKKDFEGDITLVIFPFVKLLKKSPQELAQLFGEALKNRISFIENYNSVGGFINFSVSNSYWLTQFNNAANTSNFGHSHQATGKTYIVEYSSPNTNKPLHLGHCRNIFLGYAVSEILKANGHEVIKTQIVNDRGIHICKSMLAWKKFGNGEIPQSSGIKGDHLVGKYYVIFDKQYKQQIEELVSQGKTEELAKKEAPIILEAQEMLRKWEQGDKEVVALWEMMNNWVYDGFNATYQRIGVDFDKIYHESNTYILGKDVVLEGLNKGVFFKKEDGSVWVDLTDEGLDEKLLLRGDGTSVYITQDIGTAILRYRDFPSVSGMIYTVGNEQDYHFEVLFKVLKKLGYAWAHNCYHLSYGMVDLPTGRMKSREGTVVDADELMDSVVNDAKSMTQERGHIEGMSEEEKQHLYETIGVGGLKYYLLRVEPKKRMQFNPEESVDLNGNTAPFIQYGYARIQSILRKASVSKTINETLAISDTEKELVKLILNYPEELSKAGVEYSPAVLCNYNFELIKLYNSFYQSHPILGEENEDLKMFRISLSTMVADITKRNMKLLGIAVPQKM
jgi:arginyl-tRNA synthetase